ADRARRRLRAAHGPPERPPGLRRPAAPAARPRRTARGSGDDGQRLDRAEPGPALDARDARARPATVGRRRRARADLDVLAADGFRQIARDSVWLMCIATAAEVCAGLADERAAATLEALFRPYAERVIGVGPNLASLGHGTRPLGLLARTLGRWDEAAALLERARAEHDRMGALPWLAITRLDQARTLAARSRTGRRRAVPAAARDAARDAENLARELGMGAIAREAAAFASESA